MVPQMCFHKWLMANLFLRDLKVHSRGGDHEGEEVEVGECGPQDPQVGHLAQLLFERAKTGIPEPFL